MNAIDIDSLTYHYGERAALDSLSLAVADGQLFGILGPNGGGKTTLFRILSTLTRPAAGRVSVYGHALPGAAAAVRDCLGVVFQAPSLDKRLSVWENMRHRGHLHGLRGSALRQRAHALLDQFGLREREEDRVETLSGGLQRRVELAQCLLHRPKLLLMDEPTTGLDPTARAEFWQQLAAVQQTEDVTIVFTTHLFEEGERCDAIAILAAGKVVAAGAPSELKAELQPDVITIETADPQALANRLADELGVSPSCPDDEVVRLETDSATTLLPQLMAAGGDAITSISARKTDLGDVYVARTGNALHGGEDG
jgi:ABC-2 type transport system ATP-binding protein